MIKRYFIFVILIFIYSAGCATLLLNKYEGSYGNNHYTGTINDKRQAHGEGTMKYKDAGSYTGEWQDGKRHGNGVEYDKNGKILAKGLYENDRFITGEKFTANGTKSADVRYVSSDWSVDATFYMPDSPYTISGRWDKNGMPEGTHIFSKNGLKISEITWNESRTVKTCMEGNCENGTGTCILPEGSVVNGKFNKGKLNGKVTGFNFTGQSYSNYKFEGTMKAGQKDGVFKIFFFTNDGWYLFMEQFWKMDKIISLKSFWGEGNKPQVTANALNTNKKIYNGFYTSPEGKVLYKGQYTYTMPNKSIFNDDRSLCFTGFWKRNGAGVEYSPEGEVLFEGSWKAEVGRYDGKGLIDYGQDGIYIGELKNGKRNGRGRLKYKDNNYYKTGIWKDDKLWDGFCMDSNYTGPIKDGEKNGVGFSGSYRGNFKNGKKNGKGTERLDYFFSIVGIDMDGTFFGSYNNDNKHGYGEILAY